MKPDTQAITADVITKTSEQYDELEQRCSKYEETIERLQNENKLLREENEILKQRITLLEGQIKVMQREFDTLKADFDNHKRDAAAEIDKLKREMEDERVLKVSAETCWLLERTLIDRILQREAISRAVRYFCQC
jgi:predicted RNase H-like nuclease (RuvC/YqgF family)